MRDNKGRFVKNHNIPDEWRKKWSIKLTGRIHGEREERISYFCDFCNKEILMTIKALIDKKKKQGNLFCSRKCYCKYRSDNYIGKNHPRYDKKHSDEARDKIKNSLPNRFGKESPNWKGGITSENNLLRWSQKNKDLRELVFSRDDYTCQNCGSRGGIINCHHILSWANYPEERFNEKNCITLCKKCHDKFHYGKSSFNNEFAWANDNGDVKKMEGFK